VSPLAAIILLLSVQEKPTEVVFVGTQHFISDMPQGYTPGHLRALLVKINPVVLAVEAPTNVKNPWDFAPLELQWVTKPWAEQHKVPAIPIGWNDAFHAMKVQNMILAIQKAGKGDEFRKLEARFQGEFSTGATCEDFNGEKGIDLWRQYHKALREISGKETPWETWNARIFENLKALVRDNRGKRVAVVFGAAHGYYLLDALSKEEGIRILPCSSFFPLAPDEVGNQTTSKDHLLALRLLNFGSVPPEKLEELGRHLDHLKDVKEFRADYDLFRGKYLLHKGDPGGAVAAFREVAGLGDGQLSLFDGATRLNEAGAIYGAIALTRQGKPTEARGQLKSFLQKDGLSAPMKQWAQQLLQELDPK
jgi:hypothetical protein